MFENVRLFVIGDKRGSFEGVWGKGTKRGFFGVWGEEIDSAGCGGIRPAGTKSSSHYFQLMIKTKNESSQGR